MPFMNLVKPLSRFFRSTPPPPTLEAQVTALDSGSPELIVATILGDGEEALRAAAVGKLPDGEVLRKLAGLSEGDFPPVPSKLERLARERAAQLIDAGAIDFAGLCAANENISTVLAVAALCSNPAHLLEAVASIEDPKQAARLVTEGFSSRVRQLAAQSIEDPADLKQLLAQVRGKDKSVYKIIKNKLDVLRAEEQRVAQIESVVAALCATLERHSHRVYDALYTPTLEQFAARWEALAALAAPQYRQRAQRAIDGCREVIAGHLRQLEQQAAERSTQAARQAAREQAVALADRETQHRVELAALAAAEAATQREAEEQVRAGRLAAEALALRQLAGLIAKARSELRDGNTGRAAGLRRAIEEKLPTLPIVPAYLAGQLQQLDLKLTELRQWKDYAVAPKRAALIEEMEGLVGSSEAPKVLADRIKSLQDEWKTISKGIVSDSEADWQRFHQASLAAYQPCRDYFEAQAKLRQSNLEERRKVLERLRAFESAQSGEQEDWRAMALVLREARQEWRGCFPVDRVAGVAVQAEFDAAMGRLQGRLDAWFAQNVADKKSLIERARHLLAQEPSREAIDAVKRLQMQWKEVGPAQREHEQPLWEEFREQCDAIYQKRQQVHAEYTAALEVNKGQAVALCEEVEQVAALSGPALHEGVGKIPLWRAAFESLREMPRAEERGLHDRFERAISLCQSRISQQRARDKEQSFANLLEAARRIQAYGWTVTADGASSDGALLKKEAEDFIAGIQPWPKGGADALKEAWTKAHAAADIDVLAWETTLRTLCIRSEILTGTPTPSEDQPLRRDYQVQRLMQHMGQRSEAGPDELDAMALEWVRVGPVSKAMYESLLARFVRCRDARPH